MIFLRILGLRLFTLLLYFSFSFLIEAWVPARTIKAKGVILNALHGVVYSAIAVGFGDAIMLRVALKAGIAIGHAQIIDLSWLSSSRMIWAIPLAFLNLAIYDFFYYWFHRLQHSSRWLWAQHELHHSEDQMNVTTGVRHHHLEIFLLPMFVTIPMALLFKLPQTSSLLAMLLTQFFIFFIHANARIGFGPLNRLFASPQVHRIHHSKEQKHWGKNFAAYFPLWDVIFGTYYHPAKDEYPDVGIEGRTVYSVADAALMPFKTWKGLLLDSKKHFRIVACIGALQEIVSGLSYVYRAQRHSSVSSPE